MKANFQKLTSLNKKNSFADFSVRSDFFGFHWHYHPEIEICFIKIGRGHRLIGDSLEDFVSGDLVLIGSNISHCWITNDEFANSKEKIEAFVIQFKIETIVTNNLVEMQHLINLLEIAKQGVKFDVTKEKKLIPLLKQLKRKKGLHKYLTLIQLLDIMCSTKHKSLLCTKIYKPEHSEKYEKRILDVCNFIHNNFRDHLPINKLADITCMNPASFCRFFKKALGKTAVEYINELRISYACSQLQNVNIPIYQIAFDSGFSSLAHFNKIFKRVTKKTPKEYKNVLQ
jgi:AraC-like DNA-binding protein